jgi:hypothetical protein
MHFHLPKPLHGWREFAGEVGIIVLGVLIALGFEQIVEASHQRQEGLQADDANPQRARLQSRQTEIANGNSLVRPSTHRRDPGASR